VAALLDIFGFLSVLLRAATLVFEALTVGGVIFRFAIAPGSKAGARRGLTQCLVFSAGLLAGVQIAYVVANSALLMASTGLAWGEVMGAEFCISGALIVAGAAIVAVFASGEPLEGAGRIACPIGCVLILCGAVMSSHSMARLEHRWVLIALTLAHHLAGDAWIGGMPYLVLSLRREPDPVVAGRFSRWALFSVISLAGAGVAMSAFYIGSVGALTGTAYGIMVLAKAFLTGVVVLLGALNRRALQRLATDGVERLAALRAGPLRAGLIAGFLRLRRFAEVEAGIGITILLAAASLTSSPPAIDVQAARVRLSEMADRMAPRWPRMETPKVSDLSPATPLPSDLKSSMPGSFVPGEQIQIQKPADIAWSEYNHHWAGLIVGVIGLLSLAARRAAWARHWPLAFLGLAVFLLVRADSENWPLGPRGFWESFQVAEVAQHRLFVLLIVAFAAFEWRVQTSRVLMQRASLVFPAVCAVGGALLLTHSHSLGNIKEAFLVELSHLPLAIFAVMAGWSRWLEIRVSPDQNQLSIRRVAPWIWPVCFILIAAILMNYREA
jgi:putative copper resistance protein D